jgi:isopenicillin N synthase-like dioxygenase
VEKVSPKNVMILFVGETLSRLTAGFYKPILHQVNSIKERIALPFFYRANNESILDIKKFNLSSKFLIWIKENDENLLNEIEYDEFLYLITTQYRKINESKKIGFYKNISYFNNY